MMPSAIATPSVSRGIEQPMPTGRVPRGSQALSGAAPYAGAAAGIVGLAVFLEPGLLLGSLMLAGELILGGFSLYKLWPKNR
jgi:hypothetical protein